MFARAFKFSLLLFGLIAASHPASAFGDEQSDKEYAVKAAFICKFAQFVEWPEEAFKSTDEPLVIGVIGENPFQGVLAGIAAEARAGNRKIVIRRFAKPEDVESCQVLFVPASESSRLDAIFARIQSRPILSIGETDEFPMAGGTIRFFIEDGKVHFEVNLESAQKARLTISSKLLKLAKIFRR